MRKKILLKKNHSISAQLNKEGLCMDICLESFNYANNNVVNESKIGGIIARIKEALLSLIHKIKAAFAKICKKFEKGDTPTDPDSKNTTTTASSHPEDQRVHIIIDGKDVSMSKEEYEEFKKKGSTKSVENEPKPDVKVAPKVQLTPEEEKLLAQIPKTKYSTGLDLTSETNRRKYVKIMHNTSESEIRKRMGNYLKDATIYSKCSFETLERIHDHHKIIVQDMKNIVSSVSIILSGAAGRGFVDNLMKTIIKVTNRYSNDKVNSFDDAYTALHDFRKSLITTNTIQFDDIRDKKLTKTIYDYDFSEGIDSIKYMNTDVKTYFYSDKVKSVRDVIDKGLNECEACVKRINTKVDEADDAFKKNFNTLANVASSACSIIGLTVADMVTYMDISGALRMALKNALYEIYKEKEDSIKEESFNFCTIK